jgi:hypothetical protein
MAAGATVWAMATADLRRTRAGLTDPAGRSETENAAFLSAAGMLLGIAGAVLWAYVVAAFRLL